MAKKLTKEQKLLYSKLNSFQKHIANAHIANQNLTYAKCYLKACKKAKKKPSKSPRQSGEQILSRIDVKAYVDSVLAPEQDQAASTAIMTRDESLERLSAMARGSLAQLIQWGSVIVTDADTGEDIERPTWWFKDSKDLTPENIALISELASSKEGIKIKIHDAKAAHKQLAELQGWNSATKLQLVDEDEKLTPWGSITAGVDK